jgi:hypothetical protein
MLLAACRSGAFGRFCVRVQRGGDDAKEMKWLLSGCFYKMYVSRLGREPLPLLAQHNSEWLEGRNKVKRKRRKTMR